MAIPIDLIFQYIQSMEEYNKEKEFLNDEITKGVQDANFEIINKLTKDEVNGISKRFSASGRPIIFDSLSAFNSFEVLKKLIELGADVNAEDSGFPKRSVLFHAVKCGSSIQLIKILVESGANINYQIENMDGDYPRSILGVALFYQRYQVVEYLKSEGAIFIPNEELVITNYLEHTIG